MFGTQDIFLIGIIVVVLFGATKLPQLGSGVGQAIRNFKKGIAEADAIDVTPKKDSPKKEGTEERED
jgi:sec-independent protein translocase protein TatA